MKASEKNKNKAALRFGLEETFIDCRLKGTARIAWYSNFKDNYFYLFEFFVSKYWNMYCKHNSVVGVIWCRESQYVPEAYSEMDDASAENLENLKQAGLYYIDKRQSLLDDIAAKVVQNI
jgi:hypothetical protein